ncbi:uncharacterized protein [Triticum aestivum]|uniref:uncharacterized protein isoform X6 n=1 Tax=Triticum aestivum TaxID=4565 RepID=UPI001D002B07|nr:uncharacterized protein LOC123113530 isoform X6 [Triticum aestivum]
MGLQEKRPIQMNRIPRPPIPHFVPSLHLTSAPWPPPSSNFLAGATRPKSFRHRSPSTLPTSTTAPTLAASHLRRTTPPNTASLDAMIVPRAPCSRSGLNLPYQGSFVEAAATLWKEGQGKTCLRCKPMDAEDYEECIPLLYEVLAGQQHEGKKGRTSLRMSS